MKTIMRKGAVALGLILAVILVRFTQAELDSHRSIRFVDQRPVFLPKGNVLIALTMGYRGLVGDWLWINTVLYFGRRVVDEDNPYYQYSVQQGHIQSELKQAQKNASVSGNPIFDLQKQLSHNLFGFKNRGLVNYVYPMLDGVTTADPHFIFPYLFGGVFVLMDTGEIDAAMALLKKGYNANPNSWELPFYLGWVTWMYQGDLENTYRYLLEAVGKPGCKPFVENLLKGISSNLGKKELTLQYLRSLYESTNDPDIQKRIEIIYQEITKGK